jgi:hypothetical protein
VAVYQAAVQAGKREQRGGVVMREGMQREAGSGHGEAMQDKQPALPTLD